MAVYTFDHGVYHPACLIHRLFRLGMASPAARDMDVDVVLEQLAGAGEFTDMPAEDAPQLVADMSDVAEQCSWCQEAIDPPQ